MRIKKGDNVQMLSGKDRGRSGKVIRVLPDEARISVEGLNLQKKHLRPRKQGEKGQIAHVPSAVSVSKVMLICPKCSKPTRVGHVMREDRKYRMCKVCNSEI